MPITSIADELTRIETEHLTKVKQSFHYQGEQVNFDDKKQEVSQQFDEEIQALDAKRDQPEVDQKALGKDIAAKKKEKKSALASFDSELSSQAHTRLHEVAKDYANILNDIIAAGGAGELAQELLHRYKTKPIKVPGKEHGDYWPNRFLFLAMHLVDVDSFTAFMSQNAELLNYFLKDCTTHGFAMSVGQWGSERLDSLLGLYQHKHQQALETIGLSIKSTYEALTGSNQDVVSLQVAQAKLNQLEKDRKTANKALYEGVQTLISYAGHEHYTPSEHSSAKERKHNHGWATKQLAQLLSMPMDDKAGFNWFSLFGGIDNSFHESIVNLFIDRGLDRFKDASSTVLFAFLGKATPEQFDVLLASEQVQQRISELKSKYLVEYILRRHPSSEQLTTYLTVDALRENIDGELLVKYRHDGWRDPQGEHHISDEQMAIFCAHESIKSSYDRACIIRSDKAMVREIFDNKYDKAGRNLFFTKPPTHIKKMRKALGDRNTISYPLPKHLREMLHNKAHHANTHHPLLKRHQEVQDLYNMVEGEDAQDEASLFLS